ncbi:MAG: hypothetical protein IH820_05910, partial [Bacteroidetes bacterium]|nr:hypothetical protein [Bacteroidota bacterium]
MQEIRLDNPFVDLHSAFDFLHLDVLVGSMRAFAEAGADVCVTAMFGPAGTIQKSQQEIERLREAILDKNLHWFSRYRVVDGYNVYGGRSRLAWHGQSNADVMRREMEIFDVMTANRDKRVWAIAQGNELHVKDDNIPELVVVQTNKPGPLEGGKWPYLGGQEAISKMTLAKGMQVNLFASEREGLTSPLAIRWDPAGRMYVTVTTTYPHVFPGDVPNDKIIVLEDTNGDGRVDKSTVFAEGLNIPTGLELGDGGVYVGQNTELLFLQDTDGDGKADRREVLYHGFLEGNPQHRMSGFTWGMDGWLYGAHGNSVEGKIKLAKRDEYVNANNRDFRIRPDEGLLDPQSGVSQYGRNRDDWDNWFGNANSNPMYQFVLADHYLRRNELVAAENGRVNVAEQAGVAEVFPRSRTIARYNDLYAANRFTSACSTIVYRDELFGPHFIGNTFVSEPVHNLVHREVMQASGFSFSVDSAPGSTTRI